MALTVGELQVLLSGDPSKLNRELDRIDSRAGQTEKVHTAAWSRIGAVAGTALKAGALLATAAAVGVGAALRSTVKIGMDYQDQLNTLGAVSGATAGQMAEVAATAKTLGADLSLPATSAADAAAVMTELAKASFTVEEAQTAAKGSLQLAAAAQIDAAQAATIQASALQAFSLDASQAGRVSDVLANAANASAAEITDVADALAQASAVAAGTGISIEDTAAAIGLLANNGIKGSDAGTLLKSALLALQSPSDAAAGAMGDLGLTAYDAQGNFVGLSSIFGQLSEAQRKMTPEAYAMATSTLFGSDAARLAAIAGKEGAEGFDAMALAMGRQGAAAEVAAAKAQGVRGAFQGLQSQVETLKIQGFEALSPAMETVIRKASDMVPMLGQHLFSAMEKAVGGARELHEQFGPEMAELGEVAAQKWGQFVDLLGELGSAVAPSLPALIEALVRIAKVGGEVSQAMLPALEAGLRLAGPAAGILSGALTVVADVLENIAPILPIVVGGFLAFRGVSAVAGVVRTLAGHLDTAAKSIQTFAVQSQYATTAMTGSVGAGQRVGSTISAIGKSLPLLAIATAGVSVAFAEGARELGEFGDKAESAYARLAQGGRAADQARQELTLLQEASEKVGNGFGTFGNGLSEELEKARAATNRAREAMTPLQTAQEAVTRASNNLQTTQAMYGAGSDAAAAATRNLEAAQRTLEQKQRDLDNATRSATSALLEQTQAAMAGANADLAASMANTSLTTAVETYNAALADGTLTATQRTQAGDAMTQQAYGTAQALAAQALAHSTAATDEGKQADADAALLASLQATAQQLGTNTPAAITNLIGSLEKSAGSAVTTAGQMRDLGLSVTAIPGSKDIQVNAPTEDQRRRLSDLGLTVTNIPGSKNVIVHADTAGAQAALDSFVILNSRRTIQLQAIIATGAARTTLGGLGGGGGLQERAMGGPVSARTPYIVGEEGQELFVPDVPGTIIDAKKTAAMLAAAGNRQASAMLPGLGGGGGRAMSLASGSAASGSASVGGVTKNYNLHATVTQAITLPEFINLQKQAEALYG